MARKQPDTSNDLRVPVATYEAADTFVSKLTALFARLQPVIWAASEGSEKKIEAALAQPTKSQRTMYAVQQLEMEVSNGGFDQHFFNSSGMLAREALEGLQLLRLNKFAALMKRAVSFFPGGDVPRPWGKRQRALARLSQLLEQARLDSRWYASYAVEEEISKAVLAYVDTHAEDFFLDEGAKET
jgi:hypothetical protein